MVVRFVADNNPKLYIDYHDKNSNKIHEVKGLFYEGETILEVKRSICKNYFKNEAKYNWITTSILMNNESFNDIIVDGIKLNVSSSAKSHPILYRLKDLVQVKFYEGSTILNASKHKNLKLICLEDTRNDDNLGSEESYYYSKVLPWFTSMASYLLYSTWVISAEEMYMRYKSLIDQVPTYSKNEDYRKIMMMGNVDMPDIHIISTNNVKINIVNKFRFDWFKPFTPKAIIKDNLYIIELKTPDDVELSILSKQFKPSDIEEDIRNNTLGSRDQKIIYELDKSKAKTNYYYDIPIPIEFENLEVLLTNALSIFGPLIVSYKINTTNTLLRLDLVPTDAREIINLDEIVEVKPMYLFSIDVEVLETRQLRISVYDSTDDRSTAKLSLGIIKLSISAKLTSETRKQTKRYYERKQSRINKLKTLDPVMFNFAESRSSKHQYAKLCQQKFHPLVWTEQELSAQNIKPNPNDLIIKLKNRTLYKVKNQTNQSSNLYYECDRPNAPFLGFIKGEHPTDESILIPCCRVRDQTTKESFIEYLTGKTADNSRTKRRNIYVSATPNNEGKIFSIQDEFLDLAFKNLDKECSYHHLGIAHSIPTTNIKNYVIFMDDWNVDTTNLNITESSLAINAYYYSKQQKVYYQIIMIKDQEIVPITLKSSKIMRLIASKFLGDRHDDATKSKRSTTATIAVTNRHGKLLGSVDSKGVFTPTNYMPVQPKHIIKSFMSKDFKTLVSAKATIQSIKKIKHFLAAPSGKIFAALNQQTNKYHLFPETEQPKNSAIPVIKMHWDYYKIISDSKEKVPVIVTDMAGLVKYKMVSLILLHLKRYLETQTNQTIRGKIVASLIRGNVNEMNNLSHQDIFKLFWIVNKYKLKNSKEALSVINENFKQFDFDKELLFKTINQNVSKPHLAKILDEIIAWKQITSNTYYINNNNTQVLNKPLISCLDDNSGFYCTKVGKIIIDINQKKYITDLIYKMITQNALFRHWFINSDYNIINNYNEIYRI